MLTQPTVSAATSLRISALDFASLSTLRVSDIAAVVGKPSGTAATIRTIASIKQSCTDTKFTLPVITSLTTDNINAKEAAIEPTIVTVLPSRVSFSLNGAETALSNVRSLAILPSSAFAPTAVTIILPVPPQTKVPEYATLNLSARAAFSFTFASAFFPTGRLSPVRVDSSTVKPRLSISLPSAIILSPVSIITTSPTTISSLGMTVISPPRTTFTLTLSYSLPSNSKAFSDFPSIIMVSPTDKAIAIKMPTHS